MFLYYILIWFSPYQKHPWFNASAGGLTMIKYLGGACLVSAVLYLALRRTLDPLWFRSAQVWCFVTFMLLAAVSSTSTGGSYTAHVGNPMVIYVSQAINLVITAILVDSRQRIRNVLLVAVGAVGYTAVHLIREWMQGRRIAAGYRPGWVTGDANYFTATVLLVIPVAVCFLGPRYRLAIRAAAGACLAMMLIAMVLGGSRGGLVGLLAVVPIMIWRSKRRLRNAAVFLILLAIFTMVQLLVPRSPLNRMLHPRQGDELAINSRTQLWQLASRMIKDKPLFGVGVGSFGRKKMDYLEPGEATRFVVAHNAYIEIAAEMGLAGLTVFLALIGCTFRTLRQVQKRAREAIRHGPPAEAEKAEYQAMEDLGQWASAMEAGLVGFCVAIVAFSGEYTKLFWLMMFLSGCMAVVSVRYMQLLAGPRGSAPATRMAA